MLIVLLMLGCDAGGKGDTAAPPVDLVARLTSRGPHAVGYAQDPVTYAAPTGERTLRLALWYPSDDASGASASAGLYVAGEDVYAGATLASGVFPVAVFSHGHQGYAENSGFLMEHLASHGWIVVAPDHTGNTTFDGSDRTTEIYFQRPLDISAVIDALPSLGVVGPAVADEPVLAIGHSFGGYTMFGLGGGAYDPAVCPADSAYCSTMTEDWASLFEAGFLDDRVGAYVVMAGGDYDLFGAAGLAAIDRPFLHLTASEDQGPGSEGDDIWAGLDDGDDVGVILEGGGHQSFTDYADLLEDVPLDAAEGFRIVDAFVLAWGERMRGETDSTAVLDGGEAVSEAATLR